MQTDLRYVFHVYGFITVVQADFELAIVCLSDEFRCQILDAVMGFKEMDIDGPAGIADEILVLLEDPVQARRRYFQEIIVTDGILFIEDLAQLLTDSLAVFQSTPPSLSMNTRRYQFRSRTYRRRPVPDRSLQ